MVWCIIQRQCIEELSHPTLITFIDPDCHSLMELVLHLSLRAQSPVKIYFQLIPVANVQPVWLSE
jgi:hypothetical protein